MLSFYDSWYSHHAIDTIIDMMIVAINPKSGHEKACIKHVMYRDMDVKCRTATMQAVKMILFKLTIKSLKYAVTSKREKVERQDGTLRNS